MGSGASNLSADQRAEITKRLENVYKTLSAENLEDDIIQSNITKEYKDALAKYTEPHYARPVSKTTKAKKKPTRRRSFDAAQYGKKKTTPSSPEPLPVAAIDTMTAISKSMESLVDLPAEAADNWDSVTQQPFCNLCQMAFKTAGFLDRHVKYSSVHASAVRKQNGITEPQLKIDVAPAVEEKAAIVVPKQEEGVHYKPIYSGTKLFWRTQKSIDFNFYHHILPSAIEIIAFDSEKHKELNRIYLDYETIAEIIEPKIADGISAKKSANETEKQRNRFFDFSNDQMASFKEELRRTTLITFILQRLQLQSISVENANISSGVAFVKQSVDEFEKEPVLETIPVILVPVNLTRRRRTNAEDHENIMKSLSSDHDAINNYLSSAANNSLAYSAKLPRPRKVSSVDIAIKAERIAGIMHSFVNNLRAAVIEQQKYRYVQKRWTKAIKRVIRIKNVAETTRIIERYAQVGSPSLLSAYNSPKVRSKDMSPLISRKSGEAAPVVTITSKDLSNSHLASAIDDELAERAKSTDATKSPGATSFKRRITKKAAVVH